MVVVVLPHLLWVFVIEMLLLLLTTTVPASQYVSVHRQNIIFFAETINLISILAVFVVLV